MNASTPASPHGADKSTWIVLPVVFLVAINLRPALSSLPAVTVSIQQETGWNDALLGALTTVPVLCMGVFALLVPRFAERVGRRLAVSLGLIVMTVGLLLRLMGAVEATLFASAFLAGLAIAIIGGLVPGIVRQNLSKSMGKATSIWTTAMMGGAALGAAATLPLSEWLGGWNRALALWSVPAVIALIAWTAMERRARAHDRPPALVRLKDLPWKSGIAWSLTAFMTLNSIVFYSALAWIAPSYAERGYSIDSAGLLFGVFTATQILAALTLPAISHRIRYRRTLFATTVVVCALATAAVAFAPNAAPMLVLAIWAFTLSGGFAMSLGLLSEYAKDAAGSARLTAMAFAVTYSIAAFGPFVAGVIMDAVDSWTLVFALLAAVTLLQLASIPALRRGVTVH